MGFLDALASGIAAGAQKAKEFNESCSNTKAEYRRLSDDELWDIVNGNTFFHKTLTNRAIARSILKERGLV